MNIAAAPDLSPIIVSYNTRDLLARCLDTLASAAAAAGVALDTIVVDNDSADGSAAMLADRYPWVRTIRNPINSGFAAANNLGLRQIRSPYALLLNSDAFVTPEVLRACLDLLRAKAQIGMVGVRLLNEDGSPQAECEKFPTLLSDIGCSVGFDQLARSHRAARDYVGPADWVQGACMFVRAEAVAEVGGLDVTFFMYSEEVDWCRRFWARNWQVWYRGDVAVVHLGGASSRHADLRRRRALYRSRLGLRRRLGGPASSATLWACMVLGLGLRVALRASAGAILHRPLGRQAPGEDWALARQIAGMDPLARWAQVMRNVPVPLDAQ